MPQNLDETSLKTTQEIFDKFADSILNLDPVHFCENNLTLDGKPFRLRRNGFKPFVDIYRYIGVKSLTKNSKPVVLVKGRQVGATTMAVNLALFFMGCGMFGTNGRSPMRIMHLFPQLDISQAHTKTKLNPAITQSKQIPTKGNKTKGVMETMLGSNASGDSLEFKEFQNGNHIWIESVGVNADRIRGRTADCMFFDEVQDMFKRAVLNATQLLKQAQYGPRGKGLQVYLGTPKSKDSMYYDIWMSSTQNYYFLGCEHCKEYFPLYTPGADEWEKIWLEGYYEKCDHCDKKFDEERNRGFQVRCTHCNHIQDKRDAAERGKWIGRDPDKFEYIGFHINVLYMPNFSRETIMSWKPGISATVDETAWLNEVLGEFYSGEGIVITAEEIRANCSDYKRPLRKAISPEECTRDRCVYMGCDWGKKIDSSQLGKEGRPQSGGQSYSCIVIMQAVGPQLFEIHFATKLKNNDRVYKMELLDHMMTNYNVKTAVGDIGFAYDLMCDLQNIYGDKFMASEASGSQIHGKVKYNDKDVPRIITFEREHYIEKLFNLLRAGAIRFPFEPKSYEYIAWLVQHCASMIAKPQMDRFGNVKVHYFKGSAPNDGFSALINAYIAYEFDISNGYKNMKAAMNPKEVNKSQVLAIGSYVPGMKLTM